MLEMTTAGLDAPWETTTSLMHRSCNEGVIELSPLKFLCSTEVVDRSSLAHSNSYAVLRSSIEISHACFVHLVLQYSPHLLVNWI